MADLTRLPVHELTARFRAGQATPSEAARAYLDRIAALDSELKAFITVTEAAAMEQARAADARFAAGRPLGPLDGVPVGLKDLFCTRGVQTTSGSRILEGFVPPYDGTAVARLRAAGAVLVGKLNMDEFAMGSSTEHSGFFTSRNPWDLARVPGGSSGASAAVVAADLAPLSLGTDTGGSIRQPAAFCGTLGLKPTYGRVSRYGVIAFASSLDQVGPFARDVRDLAALLQVIAGPDPHDSTAVDTPVPDYAAALEAGIGGLRVGVPREYFIDGLDPEVKAAVDEAIAVLGRLGARTQPVSLPHTEYGLAAYYLIAPAEASSNLARYDGVKYGLRAPGARDLIDMYGKTRAAGFGAEVKRRVMLGTYALSAGYYDAYYAKAQKVRTLIRRDFEAAFAKVDVIVGPTTPATAFKHGEKEDPLAMYLNDIFTVPANLSGNPGISVPCGYSATGLPIGLHLVGRAFDESTLLRVAHAYELATPWRQRRPELA
jgi:aspartyl-tRNA(Asn)/glutamyl-tRNA(Gln) amidotransferase subunit A